MGGPSEPNQAFVLTDGASVFAASVSIPARGRARAHDDPGTVRTKSPPLAADDSTRELAIARSDDEALVHLAVVGDTYTVLVSGEQTNGRFAMLDMLIPPGGGPPPHRHNFEECFRVLAGSIEVHVRDLPPTR
jgi:mannose-6-phosphate isomerase-like protein (cupin superfamily)